MRSVTPVSSQIAIFYNVTFKCIMMFTIDHNSNKKHVKSKKKLRLPIHKSQKLTK